MTPPPNPVRKSSRPELLHVLVIQSLLWALGILNGFLSLLMLRQVMDSASHRSSVVLGLLALALQVFGLAGVCGYAFRGLRTLKLVHYLACYVMMGLTAGLILWVTNGMILTVYALSWAKGYLFDFAKVSDAGHLMVFAAVVCSAVSICLRLAKGTGTSERSEAESRSG